MEDVEYTRMDAAEDRMWWYRALHQRLLDALSDVHGRVLDAGCGTGGFLARLHASRPDLTLAGLEWFPIAAPRAQRKSGVSVARGSANMLPFADASFDAAILADVLCHGAVEPDLALAEMRRVLRPGGRLIVNMPAYAWLMSAHDVHVHNARRQTARQTAAMLVCAGFATDRVRYWNSLPLPMMIVQRKLRSGANAPSDVAPFPPWLDAILHGMTQLERRLPFAIPAGGSVLAIAERP